MPVINFNVDLLMPVSVKIDASPGDKLVVLGGVVIGVYREKDLPKPFALVSEPEVTQDYLLEKYRKHGPCTARELNNILGASAGIRYKAKMMQDQLLRSGRLVAATQSRFPKYRIRESL